MGHKCVWKKDHCYYKEEEKNKRKNWPVKFNILPKWKPDIACCTHQSLPVCAQPVADLVQAASADSTQVLINPVLLETDVLMQEPMLGKETMQSPLLWSCSNSVHCGCYMQGEVAAIYAPLLPSPGTQCKKLFPPYVKQACLWLWSISLQLQS